MSQSYCAIRKRLLLVAPRKKGVHSSYYTFRHTVYRAWAFLERMKQLGYEDGKTIQIQHENTAPEKAMSRRRPPWPASRRHPGWTS